MKFVEKTYPLIRSFLIVVGIVLMTGLLVGPPAVVSQSSPGPHIRLQAASFDPLENGTTSSPGSTPVMGEDMGIYLIQFHGPIKAEAKAEVVAAGAQLYDYIPDFAFIARMDPEVAKQVMRVPAVRWVGPYEPAYRISPLLSDVQENTPVQVRISTLPGEAHVVNEAVQSIGGTVNGLSETEYGATLRVTVSPKALADLAHLPVVRWIEPGVQYQLLNDVARSQEIMNVERVWDLGLFGKGQIIAYSDSGLDVGNLNTLSADFRGRVAATHPLGEGNTTWNDPVGHGTHVAGSLVGNGFLSGSRPAKHDYAGSFAGIAPEASLVVQAFSVDSTSGEIEGLPEDLTELFQQAYDDGARIHSNSWGGGDEDDPDNPFGKYLLDAQQVDEFVWSHPDMTIVFAAGNSGVDLLPDTRFLPGDGVVDSDSLISPGTAKNAITVGATESLRPPGSGGFSDLPWVLVGSSFLKPPIVMDRVSDNARGMAAFSSRGPTDDGRIKPDVVSPGTNIVSARSHDPAFFPILGSWGLYPTNNNYVFNGGTSMATPLVAGAATLVREWFVEKQELPKPSSALIKAMLINGAVDLSPGQYGSGSKQEIPPRPNPVEGWGRVDVHHAIAGIPPRAVWFDDHTSGLQTGETVVYEPGPFQLDVVNFAVPLRVTLVWTDYPGSPAAERQLVNDLDLTVIGPDDRYWHGNGVVGDRTNNVEGVDILQPMRGRYRILVRAHNVPQGPQPYALVVSGGLTKDGIHQVFIPMMRR